jgi:transcriptional regulator of acetoin/glycerol metabolism
VETVAVDLSGRERFGSLVGQSPKMRAAFALMERAAASEVTVRLDEHGGKIGAAARAADVDRTHMYGLLWRHGLR